MYLLLLLSGRWLLLFWASFVVNPHIDTIVATSESDLGAHSTKKRIAGSNSQSFFQLFNLTITIGSNAFLRNSKIQISHVRWASIERSRSFPSSNRPSAWILIVDSELGSMRLQQG